MTGIVEVELPIEYKLKNIEATEAAKRQLEDSIKSGVVRFVSHRYRPTGPLQLTKLTPTNLQRAVTQSA